jgi:nitrogen fixation/metabolism regulation signal transduction histidine kinase
MYGAFAALGIILLLIGAWISVRVAAPIQQLIAATEKVTEGRLETIVKIKRKDEVGELAQAFNRMTAELERTRENVAQSEREGAWKEMARQVAHEIKNPLTPMKLSVQHVEHAYESGDTNFGSVFKRVIRTLSEQIDVLTRIATEFSRFGEMPRRKYGFVSLKKIVESAMALYDAERGRIRFVVDIPDSLPPIYADDEEFRRALVNLIRNSLQATEGWGVIIVSAREKSGLIHLKVSDTGGGMSAETLKKAFDPNFSTKTSGMGLGLAIVKKIITDMSGTISVESTLGKGTTFHIELPAREYPPE